MEKKEIPERNGSEYQDLFCGKCNECVPVRLQFNSINQATGYHCIANHHWTQWYHVPETLEELEQEKAYIKYITKWQRMGR